MSNNEEKRAAIAAAEAAIARANSFFLTEKEKSYLCDHVFQTALGNTSNDGTVLPEHQYPKPRVVLQ
jgi:hypothetical protein